MSNFDFFQAPEAISLSALAKAASAVLPGGTRLDRFFRPVASLDRAGPDDVTFHIDEFTAGDLIGSRAGACLVSERDSAMVPKHTIALVTSDPSQAFRRIVGLSQAALLPTMGSADVVCSVAKVDKSASLEQGVLIGAGCSIGPGVEIGAGTRIGTNSVIDAGVRIGRNCSIDAQVSIRHALIGNAVLIHAGARIGPGSADFGQTSPALMPRLGRVIIQDDVEIGSNAVVDCGYAKDTVIGDGARIGALVFVRGGRTIDRLVIVEPAAFSSGAKIV